MKCRITFPEKSSDTMGRSNFLPFYYLTIFTTTNIPARILYAEIFSPFSVPLSILILIGILWVTLVKLPDALLGGISENSDAVFVPILYTFPLKVIPEKASIVNLCSLSGIDF